MRNTIMVKLMASKKYDKVFLTGCDENTEWMLDWFMKNLREHNNTIPVVFADFGVSIKMLEKIRVQKKFHAVINMRKASEKGWFLKPRAMMSSPSKKTVWIDTDCEILDNVENLFDMFDDVEFEDSEYSDYDGLAVETTYYSNGQVWTNIWSRFEGKGKYTGNEVSFPFHISYLWEGDKIIEEVQFFSTKVFDAENEAKNNQLK